MIDFEKGKISKISKRVINSFNKLPPDTNEKSQGKYFRYRKFSRMIVSNRKFSTIGNTKFFQNKKINRYAGGKIRKFRPIDPKVLNEFAIIFKSNFLEKISKKRIEIGFHQLRIKCGKNYVGYPVPEGWHKDGFEYVIILNIGSKNIKGGVSRIKNEIDSDHDVFSWFLDKGEYILLNDRKFFHYTDPINVANNKSEGSRDTLVITIKSI